MGSDRPTTTELIARSSLGGAAWCTKCDHPVDNHRMRVGVCAYPVGVAGEEPIWCPCSGFEAMTPDEWMRRKGGQ